MVFGRGQTQKIDVMRLMAGAVSDVGQPSPAPQSWTLEVVVQGFTAPCADAGF